MRKSITILSLKQKRKNNTTKKTKTRLNDLDFAFIAANAANEKKGENILLLDVSKLTVISDYFLIVTAKSIPQLQAISKHIEETLFNLNYRLVSKEGFVGNNWTVLDFGNLIVHIMSEKERNYYKLERFWSNGIIIDKKKWEKAS